MSLRNRLITGLVTAVVALFGLIATTLLNQELIPSVQTPGTYIVATLPGASPDVVEERVTEPLETALSQVPDVESVTSVTSTGSVQATVLWPFGVDSEQLLSRVRTAVDGIRATLPEQASVEVLSASVDDVPVVQFAATAAGDEQQLAERLNSVLVPALQSVPGVQRVTVSGEREERVGISYRPADLAAHRVDTAAVQPALQAAGIVTPAGQSTAEGASLSVEVGAAIDDLDELATIPIPVRAGDATVQLGQIADIALEQIAETAYSRVNGDAALTVAVVKAQDANVVAVSHGVAAAIEQVREQFGSEVEFSTLFDQAPYIEQSIHDLSVEGGLGLLFAVLVILAFLGSFRSTLVAAISIPLSLLITMIGLLWGEYSLNILTLGALTIAVGRVVDDSIVVIENIRRRQGAEPLTAPGIVASVAQVAGAITASTLTTVAVFLPIAFVSGIAGELFRPFAVTVTIALLASLLVALTIVPTLSYWFLRAKPRPLSAERLATLDAREQAWTERQQSRAFERTQRRQQRIDKRNTARLARGKQPLPDAVAEPVVTPVPDSEAADRIDRLQRGFLPVLGGALRHPRSTLSLSAVVFLLTVLLAGGLQTDFLGEQGQKTLAVSQTLPLGSSLASADTAARKLEDVLTNDEDVTSFVTNVSGPSSGGAGSSISVTLRDEADTATASTRLQSTFDTLGEIGEVTVSSTGGTVSNDIEIALSGTDLDALAAAAEELTVEAGQLDGVTAARNDLAAEQPVLRVDVDRQAAAGYGFTQAEVGSAIAAALSGSTLGTLTLEGVERDLVVRPTHPEASPEAIAALELPVSALQQQQAQQAEQDRIQAEQDARSEQAATEAAAQLEEQLQAAREARDDTAGQLAQLRSQLSALVQAPAVDPAAAAGGADPAALAQAERQAQIASLQEAIAQTEQGVQAADEQIEALIQSQADQREQQEYADRVAQEQENIQFITGEAITVGAVASVREELTQASITRADGERQVTVFVTPDSGRLGEVSLAVTELTETTTLPEGASFAVAGASAEQEESFAQLGVAMLVAVLLVFLVMIATFNSFVQPLILLVSIPFAATGAVVLLVLTGIPLGIPALIGLLMLIGIVVTNAIVLIDLVNKLRREGLTLDDAVLHGSRLRLRPILMTAAATVFALLPMAFGLTGGGVFISQPLAIVVIGGLVTSTLFTLVLVPVLYTLVERGRERRAVRRAERRAGSSSS